jgi:magnesium-transporting ATPase (P-type)
MILRDGIFNELRSDEVVVGDLLLVREGEKFPADLILLASSSPSGTCHI